MPERKKIVVILSRYPYPLNKGDKLRAYQQISYISRFHDIYLHALSNEDIDEGMLNALQPFCREIHIYRLHRLEMLLRSLQSLMQKLPVQVGYFFSPAHSKKMKASIMALQPDTVYCQLSRTALYGKDLPFHKVIDFQDAFSTNYERIQNHYSGLMKLFYRRESRCMRAFEQKMAAWFDETTIISAFDREKIDVHPNRIVVVSNGVDISHFQSAGRNKKFDLLFSGNLAYLPNKHAVKFLIEKIAPKLIRLRPEITIAIAGASGDEWTKHQSKNIHIRGWIDDIRESYDEARIFVSPLFTGAGLQNKLLEAMSMGIPCITTAITNASLMATENEQVLIANNEEEFVSQIITLLDNSDMQHKLSENARKFVAEHFNWDKVNHPLLELL